MKVYIDNYNIPITLLVDTGADVSLIKNDNFSDNQINTNRITTLSGIGQGKIRSIGTTFFDLKFKNCLIPHYFHVVHNDFPIPCDGILGMDFFRKYNCILEFSKDHDYLILRPHNITQHIEIPITNTCHDDITLPARSEVIRQVKRLTY